MSDPVKERDDFMAAVSDLQHSAIDFANAYKQSDASHQERRMNEQRARVIAAFEAARRVPSSPVAVPTMTVGNVYQSRSHGPAEYVGIDRLEYTHEFRTKDGTRYVRPDDLGKWLATPPPRVPASSQPGAEARSDELAQIETMVRNIHLLVKRKNAKDHGVIGNLRCIIDHLVPDPDDATSRKEAPALSDEQVENAARRIGAMDPTDSFWREFAGAIVEQVNANLEAAIHSPPPAAEPVAVCVKCNGTGAVDDGEIDCYSNGEPFMNGPIRCVKDCPACRRAPPPAKETAGLTDDRIHEIVREHANRDRSGESDTGTLHDTTILARLIEAEIRRGGRA